MVKTSYKLPNHNEIDWFKIRSGIKDYQKIQNKIALSKESKESLLVKDSEFIMLFIGFYRIQRNYDFFKFYFKLLDTNLNKTDFSFNDCLTAINREFGNFEASFSSKLIHSINQNLPVWDSKVLKFFKLKQKYPGNFKYCAETYQSLITQYRLILNSADKDYFIQLFNSEISQTEINLTELKKIDFIIWSLK